MAEQNSVHKWYSHSIFGHFWNHYKHCNQWLTENGHKVIQFSDDLDFNCNLNNNQFINDRNYYNNENNGSEDVHKNKLSVNTNERKRRVVESKMDSLEAIDENESNYYNNEECVESDDSNDSELLDISEDYLKFVIETKRHQSERKRLREKKLRYNDVVEYVDISQIDSFVHKSSAPKKFVKHQDINAKRNEQMFELYGEDYKLIQGMEAALQLNFDRLCDSYQPKCWPIMPIRM